MDLTVEFRNFIASIIFGIRANMLQITNDPTIYDLACMYTNGRLVNRVTHGADYDLDEYLGFMAKYCGKPFKDERLLYLTTNMHLSDYMKEKSE